MTDEIKTIARRHLASDGANLSLRAVARDLGVVSSAIYRYFASRDELLTALILDAYNALGAEVEAADGSVVGREELSARWMAVCHAVRDWALASPHEYALIYGSPVPGYRAPEDTVAAATRGVRVLGGILQDAATHGRFSAEPPVDGPMAGNFAELAATLCPDAPPAALARGMGAWVQLFGTVSFELFGQLENAVTDKRAFFEHQMRAQATYVGL
jgi:AcrR family transcriptional regulator